MPMMAVKIFAARMLSAGTPSFWARSGYDHERGSDAAYDRQNISIETLGAEFISKEKDHADEDDEHRTPVHARRPFVQEP